MPLSAWVTRGWLEPNGFVSFRETEWSALTSRQDLALEHGIEAEPPEPVQWFSVPDWFALHLRELGEVVFDEQGDFWGRVGYGQSACFDGCFVDAAIRSGAFDLAPPLGALNPDGRTRPHVHATLAGEAYPFFIRGYGDRTSWDLAKSLLNPDYREAGWRVEWGPERENDREGLVRTLRLVQG